MISMDCKRLIAVYLSCPIRLIPQQSLKKSTVGTLEKQSAIRLNDIYVLVVMETYSIPKEVVEYLVL